jgi:tyrosinase
VRSTAMAAKQVELLGANNQSLRVTGSEARAAVALDPVVRQKVAASLRSVAGPTPSAPDRVFLNLENVRGLHDSTTFKVYINVPEGDDPAKHPDHLAGSVALFGARKATLVDGKQAGDGLTFVIEITHIVDALHLSGALDAGQLHVRLVPVRPVPEAAQVSIGRISVFRQSSG